MAQMLASGANNSERRDVTPSIGTGALSRRVIASGSNLRRRDSPMLLQRKSEKAVRSVIRDAPVVAASSSGSGDASPQRLSSSSRSNSSRRHKALPGRRASAQKRTEQNRRHSTLGDNSQRRARSTVHMSTMVRDLAPVSLSGPLPSVSPSDMLADGWMTAREEQHHQQASPAPISGVAQTRRGSRVAGSPLKSAHAAPPAAAARTHRGRPTRQWCRWCRACRAMLPGSAAVLVAQRAVRHWLARRRLRRTRDMLRRRANVVIEMKTTEESFVAQLEEIRDVFLTPLKAKALLSDADLKVLSLNVPLLLNLHQGLRDDLRARTAQWSRMAEVGDVFLKLVPFLKLHTEYVKTYDVAIQKLTELRANAPFTAFMRTCSSAARAGLSGEQYLQTLLIAPIQRIPRYQMLLGECLKATPPLHRDHEALYRAVEGVRAVANHINDSKKEDDTRRRVAALQRIIQGSIERMSWLSVEGRLLRHQYVARSFNKPTTCGACHRMIWGLRNKGFQCKQCGVALHRSHKCANADFSLCDGARSEKDERSIASVPQLFSPGRRLVKEGEALFQLPTFPLVNTDDDERARAPTAPAGGGSARPIATRGIPTRRSCSVWCCCSTTCSLWRDASATTRSHAAADQRRRGQAPPSPAPESQMYEFFTRVLYDHNSLARSVSQLYRDDSANAGRPCILISTVSGNLMRLFFDDEDTCHQWLAAHARGVRALRARLTEQSWCSSDANQRELGLGRAAPRRTERARRSSKSPAHVLRVGGAVENRDGHVGVQAALQQERVEELFGRRQRVLLREADKRRRSRARGGLPVSVQKSWSAHVARGEQRQQRAQVARAAGAGGSARSEAWCRRRRRRLEELVGGS
jgi:hypothetical protein